MCSLQYQLAPELPMVNTRYLGDGDSTKEVDGSSSLFVDERKESWIGYGALGRIT